MRSILRLKKSLSENESLNENEKMQFDGTSKNQDNY